MMIRYLCALLLAGVLLIPAAGCTTRYVFEFRHADSGDPIEKAPVVLSSLPRIHSFLDPRHYTSETGKPVLVEGQTDKAGKVVLSLPGSLGIKYVQLDGRWFAREPLLVWQPMLTPQEFEAKAEKPHTEGGRPLVRMETK